MIITMVKINIKKETPPKKISKKYSIFEMNKGEETGLSSDVAIKDLHHDGEGIPV